MPWQRRGTTIAEETAESVTPQLYELAFHSPGPVLHIADGRVQP